MSVGIEIKTYYDQDQVKKDLEYFHPDINIDLMRQPGLFSYYSQLQTKAEAQFDRLKHTRDIIEAKLTKEYREKLTASNSEKKRITDTEVSSEVALDSRMQKAESLLRQAKTELSLLIGVTNAFKQRRDSLMQMAFLAREEKKSGIQVPDKSRTIDRALRAREITASKSMLNESNLNDLQPDIEI